MLKVTHEFVNHKLGRAFVTPPLEEPMFKPDTLPRPTIRTSPIAAGSLPRRDSVDFWRGIVLCCILINHIPGNIFECLTPKNYGFSDSAEAFVFLSGLSLAYAYGGRFLNGKAAQVVQGLQWRAAKLYGLHLFLSLAAIAIFAAGATLGHDDMLMNVHGRDLFTDDPSAALVGLLSLGHQLGYFNILPLYIILIAILVLQLYIARTSAWVLLAASFAFYTAVRVFAWNIPTWPMKGTWFFNPLAWQFLMALGVTVGLVFKARTLPRIPVLLALSAAVVAFGAVSVTNGLSYWPGLQDWTRRWADLDKTSLGVGRIIHFASVAYLIHGTRLTLLMKRMPVYAPFCLIGRNSLMIFAILSLLTAFGQVVTELLGNTVLVDVTLIGGGLLILYAAARLTEFWGPTPFPQTRSRLWEGHH